MSGGPGQTLLRFTVQMGEVVLCNSRLTRIESVLDDGKVRILDLGTNSVSVVSIADLRARASIAEGATIDAHLEAARGSGEIPWQHAKVRERAVAELIEGSGAWGERAFTVAQANGVSPRTLYRWLARYRDSATTSSLIPLSDGAPRGARRLDATREILVNKIIEQQISIAYSTIHSGDRTPRRTTVRRGRLQADFAQRDSRTHPTARPAHPHPSTLWGESGH